MDLFDGAKKEMKKILIITFLLLVISRVGNGQNATFSTDGLPDGLDVVGNWVHDGGDSKIKTRFIFIYLPESDFTLSNISNIFDKFQRENCDPYILQIDIYSDRLMLERKMNYEKHPFAIDFKDDEKGQAAAKEYYDRVLPAPTGYYRAEYQRFGEYELFDYSKSKNELANTRVYLRGDESAPREKILSKSADVCQNSK